MLIRKLLLSGTCALFMGMATGQAFAQQDAECQTGANLLKSRQAMLQRFQGRGKSKLTPTQACAALGGLAANGNAVLNWYKVHGSWCNAPAGLDSAVRSQHGQILSVRGQACAVASKQKQLEILARQQQQNPGSSYGPDDVSGGPKRLPTGAL